MSADHILEGVHRIDSHVESPRFEKRRQCPELLGTPPDDRIGPIDVSVCKEGSFRIREWPGQFREITTGTKHLDGALKDLPSDQI